MNSFYIMNYFVLVTKRSQEAYQLLKETKERVKDGARMYCV